MIELAQFVYQSKRHKGDSKIYRFQLKKADSRAEEIHTELCKDRKVLFSSSGRGWRGIMPGIGTRFIDYSDIDVDKWRFYKLTIDPKLEDTILMWCRFYNGLPYDFLGILDQGLPKWLSLQNERFFYCSEVVNHILYLVGLVERNKRLRPGQIVESYMEQGLIGV